jgi:hypothetical protein
MSPMNGNRSYISDFPWSEKDLMARVECERVDRGINR